MYRIAIGLLLTLVICKSAAGQTYFQQEVNYIISVKLDDEKHVLDGNISMEYINNSSDTLRFIYMHVWPNAYSSTESAMAKQLVKTGSFDFQFSDLEERGNITGFDYHVNNIPAFYDSVDVDIQKLNLPEALLPGGKASIETPFRVKIPSGNFSRLGHVGQSYQITQWYPKPAVYDPAGWHPMPYLTQGEFYSEFGSFEVSITLPANYVLMATGDLQNQNEREWLLEKARKTSLIERFGSDLSFPESSTDTKKLTFKQSKIHDFAWFADKRYHVLKSEVALPHSGEIVETWAAFTNSEAHLWKKSTEYLNDAIYYYSLWNGNYPYRHATAVDGTISAGAGMEYPNITVIGTSGSAKSLETVIMHEVGHNWFYGILGSNERNHAWMDEGLNSGNELRYLETKYPELNVLSGMGEQGILKFMRAHRLKHKDQYQMLYLFNARRNLDQPLDLPSADYTSTNYGAIVYSKGAIVANYLRCYLGDDAFDLMMKSYFEDWKFKHPQPNNYLSYVYRALNGEDQWMRDLIFTTKKTDFKIASLKKDKTTSKQTEKEYILSVKSLGRIKGPVSYTLLTKQDSVIATTWLRPFEHRAEVKIKNPDFHKVVLDYERVSPERNRRNNEIQRAGILRKTAPLRLQWLAGIEEPERTTLYYTPIIGFNTSDGFMAGMLLHNYSLFQKQFEYKLAPMYGFSSNAFNWMGSARFNFRFQESRLVENVWIQASSSSFSISGKPNFNRFEKYELSGQIDFKRNPVNRNLSHHMLYSYNYIVEGKSSYTGSANSDFNSYGYLAYSLRNSLAIRPYDVTAAFDMHETFDRFSIEANAKFVYNAKKRGLKTRFFFGAFLFNNDFNNHPRYNWRMDGLNGTNDFAYNHTYMGRYDRNTGFANQFVEGHGNFKIPTSFGQSNEWIAALNLKFESPIKIPVGVYADFGLNAFQAPGFPAAFYNAGFYVWLVPDVVEVYFPILYPKVIRNEINANSLSYPNLIRFMINFNEINPFTLLKKVAP
jgi:hypothetical protein